MWYILKKPGVNFSIYHISKVNVVYTKISYFRSIPHFEGKCGIY